MQTKDHLALGRYMAHSFHINQPVKRRAFLIGNVMPDVNKCSYLHGYFELLRAHFREEKQTLQDSAPARRHLSLNDHRRMLIGGHTAEGSRYYVNRMYRTLRKKRHLNTYDYYRLGKAAHYLADRFTYPHTMAYADGFFAHIRYEEELHEYMRDMVRCIPDVRAMVEDCFSGTDFNGIYRAYRAKKQGIGTPLHDCFYILAATCAYMENILCPRREAAVSKTSDQVWNAGYESRDFT